MKKTISITLIAFIVLVLVSCGGSNKSYNKQYNIKDGHPKTKDCIEMVKHDLSLSEPAAKIVKYSDVTDLVTETATSHYMYVQVNNNGDVKNRTYYFPDDYSFVTQNTERLIKYQLGIDDEPILEEIPLD
jgi:hypothetical protein